MDLDKKLRSAVFKFKPDVAEVKSLTEQGANVNSKDEDGMTPLMLCRNSAEVTKVLIEHGADVNAKDNAGATALMHACVYD